VPAQVVSLGSPMRNIEPGLFHPGEPSSLSADSYRYVVVSSPPP